MSKEKTKFNLSKKQRDFLFNKGKRLNFLSGSVRSGKTYVSLLKWVLWVAEQPKNYEFIMCGKTITALKRNCFATIEYFIGNNFQYSLTSKTARIFGRLCYLEGANDERSENKIRGMTLCGAYCDEITLYPESFVSMLLSRLSLPNAKLWATCNPDSPDHYIKKKYIDNKDLDINVWEFYLTDNIFLPTEYIESVSKEYSGVFYNRFILGQWVRAEGVIYIDFANDYKKYLLPKDFNYKDITKINIGVDFGGNGSATTFVCVGFTSRFKNVIILESERHNKGLDPVELERLYSEFVSACTTKYSKVIETFADSAETVLIRGLKNKAVKDKLKTNIHNARKMKVIERIKLVLKLMGQKRFFVTPQAESLIKALQMAIWDNKKEDTRLDNGTSDIDSLDSMEYAIEPHYQVLIDYREL